MLRFLARRRGPAGLAPPIIPFLLLAWAGAAAGPHAAVPSGLRAPALTQPWFSLGPANLSGRIQAITFDPTNANTVYAGAAGGGVWKSADGGQGWAPLGDDLPSLTIGAIAVDPRDPRILIVGTGDPVIGNDWIVGAGILRSMNGGLTWEQTNVTKGSYAVPGRNGYHAIEINLLTGVALAASVDGLRRSTDDGATWVEVESGADWTDVKWRPGSADTAFAAKEYGGLYASSDGGQTFTHLTAGLPPDSSVGPLPKIAVSRSNPDWVYAGFSSAGSLLGIYRSVDGGASWSLRANSPDLYGGSADYGNVLLVDPSNSDHVFAGGYWLSDSEDGGVTWRLLTDQWWGAFHGIAHSQSGTPSVWVGSDQGLYELPDQGGAWIDRNQGLVTLQTYSVCFSKASRSLGYAGSQDHGTLVYHGSPTWQVGFDGSAVICDCDPHDPLHVYGESPLGFHYVTHDGFATATPINEGIEGLSRYVTPIDLDPTDPERLFTATSAGLFRTTNGGDAWERVGDAQDIVSISVSPVEGELGMGPGEKLGYSAAEQ